jgi:hypothetical protein
MHSRTLVLLAAVCAIGAWGPARAADDAGMSRALLVKIKRDLENQIRGLLKNLGLVIGRAKFNVFAVRAEELIENRPELVAVIRPLLAALAVISNSEIPSGRQLRHHAFPMAPTRNGFRSALEWMSCHIAYDRRNQSWRKEK